MQELLELLLTIQRLCTLGHTYDTMFGWALADYMDTHFPPECPFDRHAIAQGRLKLTTEQKEALRKWGQFILAEHANIGKMGDHTEAEWERFSGYQNDQIPKLIGACDSALRLLTRNPPLELPLTVDRNGLIGACLFLRRCRSVKTFEKDYGKTFDSAIALLDLHVHPTKRDGNAETAPDFDAIVSPSGMDAYHEHFLPELKQIFARRQYV